MKKYLFLIITSLFLFAIVLFIAHKTGNFFFFQERIVEQQLVLNKIEELGALELVKYSYNDIISEEIKRKFLKVDALAPDSKVITLIVGEAVGCVDFKKVKPTDISTDKGIIRINLPEPEICYVKIDHKNSKVYDINFIARVFNPELIEKSFKNAEDKIKTAALEAGIIEQTKENARKLLKALLAESFEEDIEITFKE